jgi:hypothetical protein
MKFVQSKEELVDKLLLAYIGIVLAQIGINFFLLGRYIWNQLISGHQISLWAIESILIDVGNYVFCLIILIEFLRLLRAFTAKIEA